MVIDCEGGGDDGHLIRKLRRGIRGCIVVAAETQDEGTALLLSIFSEPGGSSGSMSTCI